MKPEFRDSWYFICPGMGGNGLDQEYNVVEKLSGQSLRKPSLPFSLLPLIALGGLYIYTLADFLAQAPSEGFSRDVAAATVEYGFISNMQTPVVTVVNSDDTLTMVAMDGHRTSLVTLDATGTIRDSFHIDLDLYKASQLGAYRQDPNTLILFFVDTDLFMATVDMVSHIYVTTIVEPQVKSFVGNGDLLVFEKPNGLFGLDMRNGGIPVPLVTGVVLDYSATFKDDSCYVLTGIRNGEAMDLKTIVASKGFEEINDTLILGNSRDNYLKTIQDAFVQDQVLTGLFVWTDNKYGLNHLTVKQIDLRDGTITNSFSNSFPIHKGRIVIDEVREGMVSVIMQEKVHRGINLVRTTMGQGTKPDVVPLTKTRELSQLSSYSNLGNEKVLVFWDSIRTTRAVRFASTEAALVKSTTSILTVNYISLAGITVFVTLVAAFIGTIPYVLFTSFIPLLIMLAMNRFISDYRNKANVQNAVAATVGTALKIYLTWHLIHRMGLFTFRPVLIGGEPGIYLALMVSSLLSLLIASAYRRRNSTYDSLALNSFAIYLFVDYVQYIMMILVYIGSTMILDKI